MPGCMIGCFSSMVVLQSLVVAGAKAGDVRLDRMDDKSYLGRVPAGQKHVFTTTSFEYNYWDPIYVAEFLKLPKALSL